ncbi:MAG: hypothetical protein IJ192_02500 [Clostridia bacterium]|nr:hypothetical protein [Clostridia bacterium]
MGWTSYHATHYKRGTVDRKAECDAYFLDSLNKGFYRIEKSTMVGSVYYAAVTAIKRFKKDVPEKEEQYEDIPESEQRTFGVVFLTSVDMKDYYNFSYKDMEETCGPYNYDCPESILKLLSPTTSEFALQWREKCREHRKNVMLIAFASVYKSFTEDYTDKILFAGQDLDPVVAKMCYIQLCLIGAAGYVKIGNAFTEPITTCDIGEDVWFTPRYFTSSWIEKIYNNKGVVQDGKR